MNILLVMAGGFFGTICRFQIGEWMQTTTGFPVGTLSINLIGCFFLGWLFSYLAKVRENSQLILFLGTGFTGSFTTFSTFSVETIRLAKSGYILLAASYVLLSIMLGVLLALAGKILAESFAAGKGDAK